MRWLVWFLVMIELVAIGMALKVVPSRNHADSAVLVVAMNSILLLLAWKQLRKKRDCCS